jgi:hypothetical protein
VAIWLFGDADARREVTRFILHDALIEPWLTGDEILALGVPEGPAVAHVLETLRDARLDGTITDRRAAAAHVRRRAATLETGGAGR